MRVSLERGSAACVSRFRVFRGTTSVDELEGLSQSEKLGFSYKKVLTRFTFEIPIDPFSLAVMASSSFTKVSIQVLDSDAQRSFHVTGFFPLLSSQFLSVCHG
jgi:hypothetical protein